MTTKQCPQCGNTHLGLIRTQHLKFCPDCSTWLRWDLAPGQKPLLSASRAHATPITKEAHHHAR